MEKRETTTSKTQSSDKKLKSEEKYVTKFFLVCLMFGNRPDAIKAKTAAKKNYRV